MHWFPLLALLAVFPAIAAQQDPSPDPPAPAIAAKSYLLVDYNSGQRIVAQDPQRRVEPASLTKLMTAYVTFKALKEKRIRPGQVVPVSEQAWRAEGSRMFIEPRKAVTVDELIHGMIVQSGNDACIALADAIAGSEDAFVALMNREGQRLGLNNTRYVNVTGLPHADHYSTAEDIALLAAAIIRDFPEYYPFYSQREYRYNNITQANRNRLLWTDPTVDGMKTGYTQNAGYCLVTSARRGERRLISVVLGAASETGRAVESQKLLNHGFQSYDGVRLFAGKEPVATLEVYKGTARTVRAGFLSDLHLTMPRGMRAHLKASVVSMQPLLAPVRAGQSVGTMRLTLDGRPLREVPVVALDEVPLAGVFGRGWDTLRLLFQ
jgi:D-alanyl-D-alanine carboxypeptidase (penicillin-binding protein 5/6)